MKKFLIALFISCFLIAALSAANLSVSKDKLFPIETEVVNRTATTYFVYAGIDSVEMNNAIRNFFIFLSSQRPMIF